MARVARAPTPAASPRARRARPARAPAAPARARDSAPPTPARPRRPRGTPSRPLLPQLVELLPRARVDDVGLRQPAAPRLRRRQLEVALRANRVRVGRDDEPQPRLLRGAG